MPTDAPLSRPIGAPAAKRHHHGDLKNALLREGRALLEEIGPVEMSLREVARRAGVSEAAPSRHFDGKEGLLAAIATEGFRELLAVRVAIIARHTNKLVAARSMMSSYVQFARTNRGLFYLMVGPGLLDLHRNVELRDAGKLSFQRFSACIMDLASECGWPRSKYELVAQFAWSVEHGLATLIIGDRVPRSDDALGIDEMVDFAIDIALSAIAGGQSGSQDVSKLGL